MESLNDAHISPQLKYSREHPEKIKEIQDKWRLDNLEHRRQYEREYARKWRKNNPEKEAARMVRHKEQRTKIKEQAAGRPKPDTCDICKEQSDKICFDHCHSRLVFRGWICDRCNSLLGRIGDDVAILHAMVQYLDDRASIEPDHNNSMTVPDVGLIYAHLNVEEKHGPIS